MGKVRSFNLEPATRIGNYSVIDNIGRGWEGEVYKVKEVPTEATRAMKLFRMDELDSVRHLVHFAWYYEQVRCTGHFPIYYHYGQWFLDDDNGCWFLVFEFIDGKPLKALVSGCSKADKEVLFFQLASAVADVHEHGYAVGDFYTLDNVFLAKRSGIVFIDCDPGQPDYPNCDFRNDCKEELIPAATLIFGRSKPASVKSLQNEIDSTRSFSKHTLSSILQRAKRMHSDAGQTAAPCL